MTRRSGLILLVVIGVLGVLAVMAAAFVTMAQVERKASQQRLHVTQALLLARSGVEDALARLSAGQDPQDEASRYGGEDWLLDGDQGPGSFDRQQEVYHPGTLDTEACPPAQALRPSFYKRDALGRPELASVGGRLRGSTGLLSGEGKAYAVRVRCGGFYVNGGDPSAPPAQGYNAVLKRMLGTLADAVDREDGTVGNGPVLKADGENLVTLRPAAGWQGPEQVRDRALGGSQAKLDALAPYLVFRAWVDRRVIAPNVSGGVLGMVVTHYAQIKQAPVHATYGGPSITPDFERIPPAPGGAVVGRAPVDLSWARRHRPALLALLAGLKGVYLDESTPIPAPPPAPNPTLGTLSTAEIVLDWAAAGDDCRTVADRLLAWTGDLTTWQAWNTFCNGTPLTGGTPEQIQAKRDLLKANFNPNSDLNKFNPNLSSWKTVDKQDLLVYSTEFSLLPIQDRRIDAVGRVLGPDGRLLASRSVGVTLSGPDVVRMSTQREFASADLGDLQLSGDERGVRLPGSPDFVSPATGLAATTWGHALPAMSGQGVSLQSYPEPCVDTGAGLGMLPADYDGNLQRATLETPAEGMYGVTAPVKDMKALARYTAGLDLDVHDAPPGSSLIVPDTLQAFGPDLSRSLLDASKLNTLYPDGVYSEEDRTPAYRDAGNADGFHGVISFWAKNNYRKFISDNFFQYKSGRRVYLKMTNFGGASQHTFLVTDKGGQPSSAGAFLQQTLFLELSHAPADDNMEFRYDTGGRWSKTGTWRLFTVWYDLRGDTPQHCGSLLINAGATAPDQGVWTGYYTPGTSPLAANDLTQAYPTAPHRILLGEKSGLLEGNGNSDLANFNSPSRPSADVTFDEFAIYDFGGAGPGGVPVADPVSLQSPVDLAMNRYAEGRYYKGAAYHAPGASPLPDDAAPAYLTPPITLPSGSRMSSVCWTWYRPAALRDDYAELEVVDASGRAYLPQLGAGASRSTLASGWAVDRQDWAVGRTLTGPFRVRVLFRRVEGSLTVDLNIPILDSPVLDDITLVYTPGGGPRLLGWRDGE